MTPPHELSADQLTAHDAILGWHATRTWAGHSAPVLTLGGYAGSGKTTVIGQVVRSLKHVVKQKTGKRLRVAFACFTGKAGLVLRTKLMAAHILHEPHDYCGTIHGLIYEPRYKKKTFQGWNKVPSREMPYDLFVLDEASMIGQQILADVLSYGIPVLAVGDHGQLPPVNSTFNLMEAPMLRLEKIHRQAENSPIIKVSMLARLEGRIPVGVYGPGVYKTTDGGLIERLKDPRQGVVICATNRTRNRLNGVLRRKLGYRGDHPVVGESVVALRNDADRGVYNGLVGTLQQWEPGACPNAGARDFDGRKMCPAPCPYHALAAVAFPGNTDVWEGPALRDQFGAAKTVQQHKGLSYANLGGLFDWAWAITAHKSQGSEYRNVVVVEETDYMDEDTRRRWLYTATTRSTTNLAIIGRS